MDAVQDGIDVLVRVGGDYAIDLLPFHYRATARRIIAARKSIFRVASRLLGGSEGLQVVPQGEMKYNENLSSQMVVRTRGDAFGDPFDRYGPSDPFTVTPSHSSISIKHAFRWTAEQDARQEGSSRQTRFQTTRGWTHKSTRGRSSSKSSQLRLAPAQTRGKQPRVNRSKAQTVYDYSGMSRKRRRYSGKRRKRKKRYSRVKR